VSTRESIHDDIAVGVLADESDDTAHALMIVLHTHVLHLHDGALTDAPEIRIMLPITQRHAAEVAAAAWPVRTDAARTDYRHWYWEFNTRTPFEDAADVTPAWAAPVDAMRSRLATHVLVAKIVPED
jgi:hypothetical protein